MPLFPIAGGSYVYDSKSFDAQRCVNLYPVNSEVGTSKAPQTALIGTAGYSLFCNPFGSSPCRGAITIDGSTNDGRTFFVFGNALYEIFEDATFISRGTLNTTSGNVDLANNGTQLCLVDGNNGYILTLATNVFAQITDPYFLGSETVVYLDGYFIFAEPNTNKYYISAVNDGLTGDPLDFALAEGSPTNIVSIKVVHQQGWLFKTDSVQMIYNSGLSDFPFSNVQSTTIRYGCAAAFSVATTANTVFWLGTDKDGKGIVWMAEGYQPQRISTFAIEFAIQNYADISDAVGYTYQENGHYFYVLNFSSGNTTWVYDITTKLWHEKAYLNPASGLYERHRGQQHVFAFGKHLIGDYANGNIYEQSLNIYDDNGDPKRWMRTCPHIIDGNLNYVYYSRLKLDMQVGTGLESGNIEDTDPQVMLQFSNDGGYTWSSEFWRSSGKIGEYIKRVIWNRLGRARDRVFRISGSSKTKVFIIGAYLDYESGEN